MRYLVGFVFVLSAAPLSFAACGSSDNDCAEPAGDASGVWQMTATPTEDTCGGSLTPYTFPVTIIQDENALTGQTPEGAMTGTICGNQIRMSGSWTEAGVTQTVDLELTISADVSSVEGSDNWTWTDGADSCRGSESLSGTLLSFIPGTGQLPDGCDEPPITNLDGTLWFDQGTVKILSEGCADAMPDDEFEACALNWAFTQTGNDLSIVVDKEYRLEGRLCGDQLSLRGGWWLPVVDEDGFCYEDDSAEEVGIQAEGNVATVFPEEEQMRGSLVVQGQCGAEYEVTFTQVNY